MTHMYTHLLFGCGNANVVATDGHFNIIIHSLATYVNFMLYIYSRIIDCTLRLITMRNETVYLHRLVARLCL